MSGWPWHPKPTPIPVPPPLAVPSPGVFYQGIVCGNPVPTDRLAAMLVREFGVFRTPARTATDISLSQFALFPAARPLWIIGAYGDTAADHQRTIEETRKLPDRSFVEIGNEPNIGDAAAGMPKLTPEQYVGIADAIRPELEQRGMTCYYGSVSNCNRDGLLWLAQVLVLAPWMARVSVHRYPFKDNQNPAASSHGTRAQEMTELERVLNGRRVLVSETGIKCPPVDEPTQLAYLQQDVAYWRARAACDGVVIYVEGGAPQIPYGLREGADGPWRMASNVFAGAPSPMRAVAVITCDEAGDRIPDVAVTLDDQPSPHAGTTDGDGYVAFPEVTGGMTACHLWADKDGYVPVSQHIDLTAGINQQVWLGGTPVQPTAIRYDPMRLAHVDPSAIPLEQLARFRGGMWTNRAAIPYGPRPMSPDNINAMDYYAWYGADDRALMRAQYQAQGYTHAVTGPVIDPGGYHGDYPTYPGPLTQEWWDQYLDAMQEWWDAGIVPVHFALPEAPGWDVERGIAAMDPFFRQARAQRVLRVVISAWEPSPWRNADHVRASSWLAEVFPHALRGLHLEPDHNAPGLSSEIADGSLTEAQMWAHVAPYIHVFLQQTAAPFSGTEADQADWLAMWDRRMPGSWDSRFLDGYHGWPTHSAWPDHGLWAIPSEYMSYACYHRNAPEAEAQRWGDRAMAAGARAYLDGGTVAVP